MLPHLHMDPMNPSGRPVRPPPPPRENSQTFRRRAPQPFKARTFAAIDVPIAGWVSGHSRRGGHGRAEKETAQGKRPN